MNLSKTFRSLAHRDYRHYYYGQFISVTGNWVQSTIQGWLVYKLTKSSAALGAVGFAGQVPMMALGMFAGVISDRVDKRKAMIITQSAAAAQALVLGLLTVTGVIKPWHIFLLSFLLGIIGSLDMPLRQAFTVEMVGPKDLSNALALNSMMFNTARIIGPSIAGILVGMAGEGTCFIINSATFAAIIYVLFKIRPAHAAPPRNDGAFMASLKEGLCYAWHTPYIRNPLLLLALTSFVVMPAVVLMPVVAAELLGGGPQTLGLLLSSLGAGALLGGFMLASKSSPRGMGALVSSSSFSYAASLLLLALSHKLWLSCLALVFAGAGMSRQTVGSNTLLQTLVCHDMRGRVMSLYTITFVGLAPLGSLLLGFGANRYGISATIAFCAVWIFGVALWFYSQVPAMKTSVRHITPKGCEPEDRLLVI